MDLIRRLIPVILQFLKKILTLSLRPMPLAQVEEAVYRAAAWFPSCVGMPVGKLRRSPFGGRQVEELAVEADGVWIPARREKERDPRHIEVKLGVAY